MRYLVIYDGGGHVVEARAFDTSGLEQIAAAGIAIDGAGSWVLAGRFRGGSIDVGGGPLDAPPGALWMTCVAKLTPAGDHVWSRAFGPDAYPTAVAADAAGHIAIAGSVDFGNTTLDTPFASRDGFVVKLGPDGVDRWSRHFWGTGEISMTARALLVETGGTSYSRPVFVLARALTWATLFVAFVLVLLPARLLEASGIGAPRAWGATEVAGVAVVVLGAAVVLSCVLVFARLGRGTPAPFDPPRRLVVRGPYRHVRNPMYLGAAVALAGAALCYRSLALLVYLAAFLLIMHVLVVVYEEPTLSRTFGDEYARYRARVRRWLPRWRPASG